MNTKNTGLPNEGETVLFFDEKGNAVSDPKAAHTVEIVQTDPQTGQDQHTLLTKN